VSDLVEAGLPIGRTRPAADSDRDISRYQ